MSTVLLVIAVSVALYALLVLVLLVLGRRENARAVAGFAPDCAVLFSRLVRDPCVPRRRAILIGALAAYLASPIDLIPDFVPGLGYLDDAVLVAIVLRLVVRDCDAAALERHWPGPASSLQAVLRLASAS